MDLAFNSAYTVPTIIFGVSIGLIKILECIQMKYISNTKLIIKQSEQIQFLLIRLVDLNKKIDKMKLEMNTSSSSTFLDDTLEEEAVDEEVYEVDEVVDKVDEVDEAVDDNEFKVDREDQNLDDNLNKNFEIIDTVIDDKPIKKKGWLPFLF
jgi:hypothetical protein